MTKPRRVGGVAARWVAVGLFVASAAVGVQARAAAAVSQSAAHSGQQEMAAQADTSTARAAHRALPCDIYKASGAPCVAAYSTVRALYAAYNGPLYQVRRASDHKTTDIRTLTAGGYANASAQDRFCIRTSCIITKIYDQSGNGNNLTIEGGGEANAHPDHGAAAAALPVIAGGHRVYGLFVTPGVGYRDDHTKLVATGSQPQGAYMVASGTHVNSKCCFDFGNAETDSHIIRNGHMDAVNFSTHCSSPCSGHSPWVKADLEGGVFAGYKMSNPENKGNASPFVTALVKTDGKHAYAIKGGNARSGKLSTWYSGPLPKGYQPLHQEGAIVLGTGGDNSNRDIGSFFEGVITSNEPTDAADNAVQANIISVGYSLPRT